MLCVARAGSLFSYLTVAGFARRLQGNNRGWGYTRSGSRSAGGWGLQARLATRRRLSRPPAFLLRRRNWRAIRLNWYPVENYRGERLADTSIDLAASAIRLARSAFGMGHH